MKTDTQTSLSPKRTLLSSFEKIRDAKANELPEIARKRVLLTSLLSGEIAPSEFKKRVKEAGLPTRYLSPKEEIQKSIELVGRHSKMFIGNDQYTYQEILERFEEFEAQIAGQKFSLDIINFPLDPDSIMGKMSDEKLSDEERRQIWVGFCERWGLSFPEV